MNSDTLLAVIAVATLAMAIAQVGAFVIAGLAARRLAKLTSSVEQQLRPLFGHLDAIGRDAARAAALASVQVERADKLFAEIVVRAEHILTTVQSSIETPAREGRAIWVALRAVFDAVREMRQNSRARQGRGEDEDALFI